VHGAGAAQVQEAVSPGRILSAFFAALAETERDNIRDGTLEGLDAAARQGKHGGRPPVITDDTPHTVIRRRAAGETVEKIRPGLIIPTGRRKGRNPSVASIYRAITATENRESVPRRRATFRHHPRRGPRSWKRRVAQLPPATSLPRWDDKAANTYSLAAYARRQEWPAVDPGPRLERRKVTRRGRAAVRGQSCRAVASPSLTARLASSARISDRPAATPSRASRATSAGSSFWSAGTKAAMSVSM
jgi:hypothetical protein